MTIRTYPVFNDEDSTGASAEFAAVGSIVQLPGRSTLYKVTGVLPKNFRVIDQHGSPWKIRRSASLFADPSLWTEPEVSADTANIGLGSVVKFTKTNTKIGDVLLVVIKTNGADLVNLAELNGHKSTYWASVPRTLLSPIDHGSF